MVEMLQQQQREITEMRSEMTRQRAIASNISQLSMQLDSLSASVTDRVAAVLQEQHQHDCILLPSSNTVVFDLIAVSRTCCFNGHFPGLISRVMPRVLLPVMLLSFAIVILSSASCL